MNRRTFLSTATALPLLGCSPLSRRSESFTRELDANIRKLMAETTVPGLSVVLIQNGRVTWRNAYGFANATTKQPATNETIFQAASMSKPVFAYMALKLCEDGILDLDAPLTRYTPEPFIPNDPLLHKVTARHLLSHSSGFPTWRSGDQPFRIDPAPGQLYRYSGEGYFYLQSVITRLIGKTDCSVTGKYEGDFEVCGSNFDEIMRAKILHPFGMRSSSYLVDDNIAPRLATGHDEEGKPFATSRPRSCDVARYGAAGALLCTPTDYARFLNEALTPRDSDKTRLSERTWREMIRPHIKVDATSSWALGWAIQHTPKGDYIVHGGDNKGFHCFAVASPTTKDAYVIMTNGDNGVPVLHKTMAMLNEFLDERA